MRRAIVLLEQNDGRVGEGRLEFENVANVGTTEPIDRLVAVTDHTDLAMLLSQHRHDGVLHLVGVLIFVDENKPETTLIVLEHVWVLREQLDGVEQQIVEVHRTGFLQPQLVLGVHLGDLALEDCRSLLCVLCGGDVVILGCTDR